MASQKGYLHTLQPLQLVVVAEHLVPLRLQRVARAVEVLRLRASLGRRQDNCRRLDRLQLHRL